VKHRHIRHIRRREQRARRIDKRDDTEETLEWTGQRAGGSRGEACEISELRVRFIKDDLDELYWDSK